MRVICAVLLAVLSACAGPPAQEQPEVVALPPAPVVQRHVVWQGLSWGMTRQEIVARLPQAKDYSVNVGGGKRARFFGIPRYEMAGCRAQVTFILANGGLTHVLLAFETGGRYQHCDDVVIRSLDKSYGRPLSSDRQRRRMVRVRSMHWLTPDAHVDCDAISMVLPPADRALMGLTITFRPATTAVATVM